MTKPGKWYLDRKGGKIIYWPLPDEDMSEAVVLAPTVESVIHIQGDRSKPIQNITLQGFRVAVTTTPLMAGGFGAAKFAGAIQVGNAQNCRLHNLEIFNVGGQGINENGGRIDITHCHIHHIGACGIKAPGCVVTDNHILYSNKGKVIGQTITNYSTTASKSLKPDKMNTFAAPKLQEYKTGRVKFRTDSPAHKLGIPEINVSIAGPRKENNVIMWVACSSLLEHVKNYIQ